MPNTIGRGADGSEQDPASVAGITVTATAIAGHYLRDQAYCCGWRPVRSMARQPQSAFKVRHSWPHVEGEMIIMRPVEEVFDFVADEPNEPAYNRRMVRTEKISPGAIGAGARFRA